jgi:hypothetical protein
MQTIKPSVSTFFPARSKKKKDSRSSHHRMSVQTGVTWQDVEGDGYSKNLGNDAEDNTAQSLKNATNGSYPNTTYNAKQLHLRATKLDKTIGFFDFVHNWELYFKLGKLVLLMHTLY